MTARSVLRHAMLALAVVATATACAGGEGSSAENAFVVRLDLSSLRSSAGGGNAYGFALLEGATTAHAQLRDVVVDVVNSTSDYSCSAGWNRFRPSFVVHLGSVPRGRGMVIAVPEGGWTTVTYFPESATAPPPAVRKRSLCRFDVDAGRFYDPSDARTIPRTLMSRLSGELRRIPPAYLQKVADRVPPRRLCAVGRAADDPSSTILQVSNATSSPPTWAEVRLSRQRAEVVAGEGEPPVSEGHLAPPVLPCVVRAPSY
ncbi:MAG: hypothetical protein ABR521_11855 [Gaiellaceae bacterium]